MSNSPSLFLNISGMSIDHNSIVTDENIFSSGYTDLTTLGPTVTLLTGTRVVICMSANMYGDSVGGDVYMSIEVSGASSIAASDTNCVHWIVGTAGFNYSMGNCLVLNNLTPGQNIFTVKYRCTANTNHFYRRHLMVLSI